MPSPFPGMDPYLEDVRLWPQIHLSLIMAIRDELARLLRPRYYVAVDERVHQVSEGEWLAEARPDLGVVQAEPHGAAEAAPEYRAARVPPAGEAGSGQRPRTVYLPLPSEFRHRWLEIRRTGTQELVTVVELLSPANKRPGRTRRLYETKRLRLLASPVHLVEIDLLRTYGPMPMSPEPAGSHYRILVSRAPDRPRAHLWAFTVRDPVPPFPVPVDPGEQEPLVRLGDLLNSQYDKAGWDLQVDYSVPPEPPLAGDDAAWAAGLVAEWHGRRIADPSSRPGVAAGG